MNYSVKEARNNFTQVLKKVESGESATITRNGRPIADIVPAKVTGKPKFGTLKGQIHILDPNWDRPQNDLDAWLRGDV